MTWPHKGVLERAREVLTKRYPGETIEIVRLFDIAHVGWEADHQGTLATHDGIPEIVVIDDTGIPFGRPIADWLVDQVAEYRKLIAETESVLQSYRAMGGLFGEELLEARRKHHQRQIAIARREGESDVEYDERMRLWKLGEAGQPSTIGTLEEMKPAQPDLAEQPITSIDIAQRPGLPDHTDMHGNEWALQRGPGETDEEFERRKQLFAGNS
jgi:hypothetical protein